MKKSNLVLLLVVLVCNLVIAQGNFKIIPAKNLKNCDIGNPALTGQIDCTEKTFEISAGGSDIWGKRDEFHFSYKKLKGDFDFSVQILSLSKANQYTKAGIMARVDLTDNSQHVYYQIFPDNTPRNKNNGGCEFQYRREKGGEMKAIYPDPVTAGNQFDVTFPYTWIRLKRQGDIFESYISHDNKSWKLYTTYHQKMPKQLFVGLAVTSHNKSALAKAGFGSIRAK